MNDDSLKNQFDLWHDFKNQISYVNRFLQHHDLLDRVKDIISNNVIKLSEGTILHRARIYNDDVEFIQKFNELVDKYKHPEKYEDVIKSEDNNLDNIRRALMEVNKGRRRGLEERDKSGFWGYDEQESFLPQNVDTIKDGRANPSRIKYLYVADHPNTALAEVRPLLKNYVSIAQIEVKNELNIADLHLIYLKI